MAYGLGAIRTVALFEESSFGQPPADWSASGTAFYCVEPNFEGVQQGSVPNQNYTQRPNERHTVVQSLRNCQVSFGVYAHGRGGSGIAEGSSATSDYQASLMQNAWGGVRLGLHANIEAGSTATIVNVGAGQGASLLAGSVLFMCDTSDGSRGRFVVVGSRSTDALTLKTDVPFGAPAATDTGGAVVTSYCQTAALISPSHADYLTHSLLDFGELADDIREVSGCKLNLTAIEGTNSGESPLLRFEVLCATHDNEGLTAPTLAAPVGEAQLVVGQGEDTFVMLAEYGTSAMAAVVPQSISIVPGFKSQPVPGVGGVEGRLGYTMVPTEDTTITLVVDFDDSWATAWENGTQYHLLYQVGTEAGVAIGWYAPRMEIVEDPMRTVSTDMTTMTIKFRCLEDDASTTVTGAQLDLFRCPLIYMRSVPNA